MDIQTNFLFRSQHTFKNDFSSKNTNGKNISLIRFHSIEVSKTNFKLSIGCCKDDRLMALEESEREKLYLKKNGKLISLKKNYNENSGFLNLGNTCFMNSILQCLRYTKPLIDFCLNEKLDFGVENVSNCTFLTAYAKLMKMVSEGTEEIPACEFKDHMTRLADKYRDYSQHDAQEFLIFLLEMLHCDLKRLNDNFKQQVINGFKSDPDFSIICPVNERLKKRAWNLLNCPDESEIKNIFVGTLVSCLKCTNCKSKSKKSEPFLDLSLPLTEARNRDVTITDCFNHFTKVEVLDGENKPFCEQCNSRQMFHKKLRMEKFPKILILHLKRFTNTFKQEKLIKFPLKKLNLTKYAENKNCQAVYDLYAVSNHVGTLNNGHYTACARDEGTGEWNLFNDSKVTRIEENKVVTPEAYILFYEKVQ